SWLPPALCRAQLHHRRRPMRSSFPSTDGASQVRCSAGTPTTPACLSIPLRAVRIALQLDLHPPRSPCPSGQNCSQTTGSRSLTEYVTVIPNVSTKLKAQIPPHAG